jgi:NADPH:quinone reductase-like Zn-dependent oxidoreductase
MRGVTVVATAGPASAPCVRDYGASEVFDYHDPCWSARVREASRGGRGVEAAVNTARGGEAAVLEAVADGGRLATITGDPPRAERGVTVADVYVRPDGPRLGALVAALAEGALSLHLGATVPLAEAAAALEAAAAGRASGATVLML